MSQPMKTESTWQQGCDAFKNGARHGANPYADGGHWSQDRIGWENGWMWAHECARTSATVQPEVSVKEEPAT